MKLEYIDWDTDFVFHSEGSDDYYFAYLEFGRCSINRQTYVNKLKCTISPVRLSMRGVGAFRKGEHGEKSWIDTAYASSYAEPLKIKPMKDSLFHRVEHFIPMFAVDGANGSRWMAHTEDKDNWLVVRLDSVRNVQRSEIYFVRPTAGHAYLLEASLDGKEWFECGGHQDCKMQSPHTDLIGKECR